VNKSRLWRTATPSKVAEKHPVCRVGRNLNLRANETEKDPVRVAENHSSRIKEAILCGKGGIYYESKV